MKRHEKKILKQPDWEKNALTKLLFKTKSSQQSDLPLEIRCYQAIFINVLKWYTFKLKQ